MPHPITPRVCNAAGRLQQTVSAIPHLEGHLLQELQVAAAAEAQAAAASGSPTSSSQQPDPLEQGGGPSGSEGPQAGEAGQVVPEGRQSAALAPMGAPSGDPEGSAAGGSQEALDSPQQAGSPQSPWRSPGSRRASSFTQREASR